jgi:Ca-activated chloride channel family protein
MVVFSDGEKSSEGLKEAAAGAAREGIFIYAMGMGTREGSFIPDPRESDGKFRDRSGKVVFSKLNEEALQVIAKETNGYYSEGLGAGFIGKLDSALAEMDRFQEEGKHQRVAKPAHRWFVFGGLLLIMASIFIKCLPLTPTVVLVAFIFATPRTEASLVEDGIAALKAGETTTAQQLFSEAARDSKGDHAASLYLASGSAASRAQDWSTAVASFSSALLAEDSEILQQAHYALATSLFYLGVSKAKEEKVKAWEGSIEHFKASLKIDAENEASRENLESVEKKLAELQEEKPEEEKKQDKENQKKQDSEKSDPKEETENDKSSEGTSDESEDEQSNQKSEKEDNPSEEDGEQNQTNKPKDGESENIQQSDKSKANDKQPNQDQSNEGKANQPNRNKTQAENSNLKDDPNAPKNETPRERARRLLKQYSDFGGKAPRRIRRPYNRSPHDW